MKALRCLLGRHTTNQPIDGRWHATWRCVRCGKDLREAQR